MNRMHAMRAQLTRHVQRRWTRFWRWYRTASRRTKIAAGISALIGIFVMSSLAVAVFNAAAHPSGTSSQAGGIPAATSGGPRGTPRPTAPGHRHGHGHHKPNPRSR